MPEFLTIELTGALLVFARLGAVVMLLPGIGEEGVPPRVRLLFAILFALVVYPAVVMHLPPMPRTAPGLVGMLVGEIAIGLMLGAIVRILYLSLAFAASVISLQTGLASAIIFNPAQAEQSAVLGRFMALAGVVLIFAAGLHHMILSGIVRSYMMFAPGSGFAAGDFAQLAIDTVAASFALGLQMAAPFLVYGIVFNVGLGLVSRLTPAIQVFFIAQPLNLLLGFALLLATMGLTMALFVDRFGAALRTVF